MLEDLHEIRLEGQRVLLTSQLAKCYETTERRISENYMRNADRYIPKKHYFSLQGENLRMFKDNYANCVSVGLRAPSLYLWTEHGALLHAKSLNTNKAWDVYDWLVDFYFRAKSVKCSLKTDLYYFRGEPIIPDEDFFAITKPDKKTRELFYRREFFIGGYDWNGISDEAKITFEKKYNRTFEEPNFMLWLYLRGAVKALDLIQADIETRERVAAYFPQSDRWRIVGHIGV